MRLLEYKNDNDITLSEYYGSEVPPYAVLSHRWGRDSEEVTFRNLEDGSGKNKAGYKNILFCGRQAARDGLRFFWIDTCCIDKSSSAELSEAINSMFHWYNEAARCYVYLSDVTITNDKFFCIRGPAIRTWSAWESAFRKSKWFTRCWTLQELIAPPSVEFFSAECERLGTKQSLQLQISEITGISADALQGVPLHRFSVEERMAWAARREARREEDEAYSLLGIFDVNMPLIYGERKRKAFNRLREEINKNSNRTL
jgi:Heterokaryon incompatibility protein (HET)